MIPVKNVMEKHFAKLSSSAGVGAAVSAMDEANIKYALVQEAAEIRGVATARGLAGYPSSRLVADCPIEAVGRISQEASAENALKLLDKRQGNCLLVVDEEGSVAGIVTRELIAYSLLQEVQRANKENERHIRKLTRAEKALNASRASFRAIVEGNPDGILVVDEAGIVRYLNPVVKTIFGEMATDLEGNCFGLPVVGGASTEIDIIRQDKEPGVGEMRVVRTGWEGQNAYLVSVRDITERKRAEENIVTARKLAEDASRGKSEFLSNVSHEMRTPLTSMRNALSNILAGVAGKPEETLKEYLEMLDADCRRLYDLVANLLDMSRFNAGKISLDRDMVDLRQPAQAAVLACHNNTREKKVNVTLEMPASLPPLYCDGRRIQQVFTNLVENAAKFSSEGGTITIRAQERGGNIQASVMDTGIGIAPENREMVFERFSQINRQAGTGARGTGPGLAICKEIVSLHGGKIWVESEPSKGSTFFFTLPKGKPGVILKQKLTSAIERAKAEGLALSVLLVKVSEGEATASPRSREEAEVILYEAGQVLRASLRVDDVVLRPEDDLVASILPGVDRSRLQDIADHLEKHIRWCQASIGMTAKFSLVVGMVAYPEEGTTAADLLERAAEKLCSSALAAKESAGAARS